MSKKIKRLNLIMILMAVLLFVSACGGSGGDAKTDNSKAETKTEEADTSKEKEPSEEPAEETNDGGVVFGEDDLQFSFYGHYDWYTMAPWGEDQTTKWIQDNKKVTIDAISSDGSADQKLSTMIMSDSLPDVIWLERGAEVENLRKNDMLVPFDDYIDKYDNYKEWVGESTANLLRSPDGLVYQFPNWYTSQANGNTGYVINNKIYTELGKPRLKTTDDLYEYLKQVKENYPGVIPCEVAIDYAGFQILGTAFAEEHPFQFNSNSMLGVPNKETKIMESVFTNEAFLEGMVYVNKLYQEGLITQDAFTQMSEQSQQNVVTGNVAVFLDNSPTEWSNLGDTMLKSENPDDPDVGYIMIPPIYKEGLDQDKITPGSYNQLGWNVAVITKNAENPEAIFAFWDWMTGPEGQATLMWGPTDLYWDGLDENDVPRFNDAFVNDTENRDQLMDSTSSFQWCGNSTWIDNSKIQFEETLPMEQRRWDSYYQSTITWKSQLNASEWINLNPPGDSDEGIIRSTIVEIFDTARSQAIQNATSEEEVRAIFEKAETDAQNIGYSQLLEYTTDRWHENLELLGAQ